MIVSRTGMLFTTVLTFALHTHVVQAQSQTASQQKCINGVNKAVSKVARAQSKWSATCIKTAGKGLLGSQTAQECVENDAKQKVSRANAKTLKTEAKSCGQAPSFGFMGGAASNAAARDQELFLLSDVFGSPLQGAITTKDATVCQSKAAKAYGKIGQSQVKEFLRCKKGGLKSGAIDSAAALATTCYTVVAADTKQKVSKATAKLSKTLAGSRCFASALDMTNLFVGSCVVEAGSSAGDLTTCIARAATCRTCLMLNAVDGLAQDCDQYDDGVANGSCIDAPPTTTTTTTSTSTTTTTTTTSTSTTTTSSTTTTTLPQCANSVPDPGETDVDCGGPMCPPCAPGGSCLVGADCDSLVCLAGICQLPMCGDGVQNGDETDIDCGGSCPACADGLSCSSGSDCQSGSCSGGTCQGPTCSDGVQNQGETGVDCGGPCAGCANGASCSVAGDCASANCANGICGPANCQDRGNCIMFVTSVSNGGNVGGLAGADSICNNRAAVAGICGGTGQVLCNYQAWMCDGVTAPADRSAQATVPYVRTDGATIANNWADLTDGSLQNAINRDENGGGAVGSPFLPWTYVKTNGTCDDETYVSPGPGPCPAFQSCELNCAANGNVPGWDSSSGWAQGSKGDVNATNGNWTDGVTGLCSTPSERHYCIEQ